MGSRSGVYERTLWVMHGVRVGLWVAAEIGRLAAECRPPCDPVMQQMLAGGKGLGRLRPCGQVLWEMRDG